MTTKASKFENMSALRHMHIREDADDEAASETAYHRKHRQFGRTSKHSPGGRSSRTSAFKRKGARK